MPTTTKMGIVYPSSTDLVKDGATAMGTISTTVDSKTGLVFINTTSFSAVSSISVNDVFSTNFDHYRIICNAVGTNTGQLQMRMRVSGTDNSSANYTQQFITADSGSIGGSRVINDTRWYVGRTKNTMHLPFVGDVFNPFATARTTMTNQYPDNIDSDTINTTQNWSALEVTTSYTGFTVLAEFGTITGSVSVFGYNK
jgi:hypothetical protein